jgi:hypothetical protein
MSRDQLELDVLIKYLLFSTQKEAAMNPLDALSACSGSWRGTSTLQDPHAGIAVGSLSTLSVRAAPGGVRLDYAGATRASRSRDRSCSPPMTRQAP